MLKPLTTYLFVFAFAAIFSQGATAENLTKITWLGHSAFEIKAPSGMVLLIDPWIRNPLNSKFKTVDDLKNNFKKVDYILLTHGHFDHLGDTVEIGKFSGAKLITNFELGTTLAKNLGYPEKQAGMDTLMNTGGELTLDGGNIRVAMVEAHHTSGVTNPHAKKNDPAVLNGGNAASFVVMIKNGPSIYHSGDTAYFSDMKWIGDHYAPDLALINIGGHFGIEPVVAAKVAQDLKAKLVVPHHYATFPILAQDPGAFFAELDTMKIAHQAMQPNSTITFDGKNVVNPK